MHTAPGRRFPSITNEGAIQPHESAFARWSSPDFGAFAPIGGHAPTPPATMDAFSVPSPAATERSDTMAAHNPPTFTVYTPDQMRSAPLRRSMPDYGEVNDGVGARTLLKWTGIGIVAGLAVLTALIVVLNFGGDRNALTSAAARSALVSSKAAETPAVSHKVESPVAAKPVAAPKADIEIATPAPPAKKAPAAAAPAKVVAKKKK